MTKRVISLVLAALAVFSLCAPALAGEGPAEAPDVPAPAAVSGVCGANGSNLKWTLSADGTLTISGSGKMKDYDPANNAPGPVSGTDCDPYRNERILAMLRAEKHHSPKLRYLPGPRRVCRMQRPDQYHPAQLYHGHLREHLQWLFQSEKDRDPKLCHGNWAFGVYVVRKACQYNDTQRC